MPDGRVTPMSDTRTDREELARLVFPLWDGWVVRMPVGADPERYFESEYKAVDSILAAGFARRIPAPSTIAVPHTPEEIWAFADRECDANFWNKDHLEYADDGVLHLASNVNITADREHLPVELRPDIGVDW
jgi:hypothetical protein